VSEGLYYKYAVRRRDAHGIELDALLDDLFVLRPERDLAARKALVTYAESTDDPALATALWNWIAKMRTIGP